MRVVWACLLLVIAAGAWSTWRTLAPGDGDAVVVDAAAGPSSTPQPPTAPIEAPPSRAPPSIPAPAPATAAGPAALPGAATPAADPSTKAPPPPPAHTDPRLVTLDDRFVVRGSGTESDPLRIPWDLLVSAQETYDPPAGRTELPSRVTQLSGQIVRITGYFAAGVLEDETRDLIVMLNKWDGCCLGVPPTPYDAVEVTLAEPVRLRGKHMLRYGTVTGRLEVEPFLVAGWLMSVYRMVDARLEWGG